MIAQPLYDGSSEASPHNPIWSIINPFMALAVVLGVIFGYIRKRGVDQEGGGAPITREFLSANTLFYGFLFVGILFFWNWFSSLSPGFYRSGDRCGLACVGLHRRRPATAFRCDGPIPAERRQVSRQFLAPAQSGDRSCTPLRIALGSVPAARQLSPSATFACDRPSARAQDIADACPFDLEELANSITADVPAMLAA